MAVHKKIHKEIRIVFTVDGRSFNAVGFLEEGEPSVEGKIMLDRVAGERGGVIGEEDEDFLYKRAGKLPKELQEYHLVMGRRFPGHQQYISCHYFDGKGGWRRDWYNLNRQWDNFFLVVCRE